MKFFLLAAFVTVVGAMTTACTDYQDEIDALDKRVTRLENLVDSINKNIEGLRMLVNAQAQGWIITGMAELPDGNGYLINFGKLDTTTGEISTKPEDKKTVTIFNGINGKDADAPVITMQQDPTDGNYYWVVNGEWLLTPDGQKIRANGKDGQPGKDGVSTAPQIRINDQGYWQISTDGGKTWDFMLNSKGERISATGKDGADGVDAQTIISDVKLAYDVNGNRYLEFTIKNGGGPGIDLVVRTPIMS